LNSPATFSGQKKNSQKVEGQNPSPSLLHENNLNADLSKHEKKFLASWEQV